MAWLLLSISLVFFVTDLLKALKVSKQVWHVTGKGNGRTWQTEAFKFVQAVRLQQRQNELRTTHARLLQEAAKLSSPATFAQSAKLQRMAIIQEKEADKLETQQVWANCPCLSYLQRNTGLYRVCA